MGREFRRALRDLAGAALALSAAAGCNVEVNAGGATSLRLTACDPAECAGIPATQEAKVCPDGSELGRTFCAKHPGSACAWEFPACPTGSDAGPAPGADAGECTCSGPRPLSPNIQCSDGTVAGPVCSPHTDGTCSWEIRSCPVACPALGCNPYCPNGAALDANGCPTCQCAPALADAGAADAGSSDLRWYRTCGDPVCRADEPDAGISACGDIKEGDACTQADALCNPGLGCGVMLRCATGKLDQACPISSQKHKKDINYLTGPDLQKLASTLRDVRLATYWYKDQPPESQKHLGFIIEDNPDSPAVFVSRDRVDLYGYTSMAVAALQVQGKQIQALEQELAALKQELAKRTPSSMCEP